MCKNPRHSFDYRAHEIARFCPCTETNLGLVSSDGDAGRGASSVPVFHMCANVYASRVKYFYGVHRGEAQKHTTLFSNLYDCQCSSVGYQKEVE